MKILSIAGKMSHMKKIIEMKRALQVFAITLYYLKKSRDTSLDIEELREQWTHSLLKHLNIEVEMKGKLSEQAPLILVGNHISYLDILVVFSAGRNISFVAKKELASWPVLGPAAQRVKTIFVKRESSKSRQMARTEIQRSLTEEKKRVVIFPSGTTTLTEDKVWKRGAFEMAQQGDIPVQCFRLRYEPMRAAAYIDDDNFFTHLMHLSSLSKVKVTIEFQEPRSVKNVETDPVDLQKWTQEILV